MFTYPFCGIDLVSITGYIHHASHSAKHRNMSIAQSKDHPGNVPGDWTRKLNTTTREMVEALVVPVATSVAPFGKFERLTAGVSMGTPFFLVLVECDQKKLLWLPLLWMAFVIYGLPYVTRLIKNKKYLGIWLTTSFAAVLTGALFWLSSTYTLDHKESISAYVTMKEGHVFGMMLTMAAVLFAASGVVYWEARNTFKEGWWRSIVNVLQGVFLLGVVIWRFDVSETTHFIVAGGFFTMCGVSTLIRGAREETKWLHRVTDWIPVLVMAFFIVLAFNSDWATSLGLKWVDLFVAECIALWVSGVDFILVSLKKDRGGESTEEAMARAT